MTSPFGKPTTRYVKEQGLEVKRGAFAGLRFPSRALGHTNYLSAKLMGVYEPDVVQFLSDHAGKAEVFVDLGSGDGFFCAGVARKASPEVIGFETNQFECKLAHELARKNGVQIETRGLATEDGLNDLPRGRLLLLSDVEGLEEDLIDPEIVPRLREATMVIETHEQFRPNVIEKLNERFSDTHDISRIFKEVPGRKSCPEVKDWSDGDFEIAAYDGHHSGDSWMTLVPKKPG